MPVPVLDGRYALGRKAYDHTRPNVKLRRQRGASLNPPPARDWGTDAMNYMALNDEIGCCTISAKAHALTSTEYFGQGRSIVVPDSETARGYTAVSGWDPKTGKHDDGASMQESFDWWRKDGFVVDGNRYQIEAFAELEVIHNRSTFDHDLVRTCIDAFDFVDVGMVFPDFAMDQFDSGKPWDYSPRKRYREEGGHDFLLVAYGGTGAGAWYEGWTWGKRQRVTIPFFEKFFEEFWTGGDKSWQRADGSVPNGLDGASAEAQFEQLTKSDGPGWTGAHTPPPASTQDADRLMAAAIDDLNASAAVYQDALRDFNASASMWRAKHSL